MPSHEDIPQTVCDALASGELGVDDLSARRLGGFVGKTTSVLYHHWGSLDGFLFAVSQAALRRLGETLIAEIANGGLVRAAEVFVEFGIDHPVLYDLMFGRQFDWDALRARGVFDGDTPSGSGLWNQLVAFFSGAGSTQPDTDARVMYAGLHGLVHLALSGRANVGVLSMSDRDAAKLAARSLAQRLLPDASHASQTSQTSRGDTASLVTSHDTSAKPTDKPTEET